jgi:hypothetical protein
LREGICEKTHKRAKNVQKKKYKYHSTQAQWRETHNQAKQGPKEVENEAKLKSKHLNFVEYRHGPT